MQKGMKNIEVLSLLNLLEKWYTVEALFQSLKNLRPPITSNVVLEDFYDRHILVDGQS